MTPQDTSLAGHERTVSILSPHSTHDEDAALAARLLSGQLRNTMGHNDMQVCWLFCVPRLPRLIGSKSHKFAST
jgi:hypothetical protein